MMLPATDGGRVIPIPSPHENQRGGTMNFLCRLFLLEDKGRHVSVHYGLLLGRIWHSPASRQSPALPRLSLRFGLCSLHLRAGFARH